MHMHTKCAYVCTCVYTYTHMYTYLSIRVCVHMCVCVHIHPSQIYSYYLSPSEERGRGKTSNPDLASGELQEDFYI